jgi:hypothetical protein
MLMWCVNRDFLLSGRHFLVLLQRANEGNRRLKMFLRDRAWKAGYLAGKSNFARGSLKEVSLWSTQENILELKDIEISK